MISLLKTTLTVLITFFISTTGFAESHTIEMLNKSGNEMMVYSKKIVKVNVGDTVSWKATTKGHKFKSKMNVDVDYKFEVPGIYAYWCTPHKAMGMIGFVVVGEDKSNLDKIKAIKFVGKSKKIAPELISQL
jgi:pseudoazurin